MYRLRVPLLTLGFCGLAVCAVFWDVHRRAAESIRAHQREVEAYYAQAEDPRRSRPALFEPPSPGSAWGTYRSALREMGGAPKVGAPENLKITDPFADLSVLRPDLDRLSAAFHQPLDPPPDPEKLGWMSLNLLNRLAGALAGAGRDRDAMDLLMVAFGLAQDIIRLSEEEDAAWSFQAILDGADTGLRALESHALGGRDLQALCATLDRLDQTRPALADAFEWSRLAWTRKAFLEVFPKDPPSNLYTWKDFSSRTLFRTRALREIDAHHRANAERGRRPSWERVQPVPHGDGDHAVVAQSYSTYFCCAPNLDYVSEVNALENRALLRVALALAWYEAEMAKPAASLQDLVPRYLPALDASPLDGKPFGYAEGTLSSRDLKGKTLRWPVKRR